MQRTSSLAIDQEAQICDLTAEMLADAGYIVHVVQDGEGTLATMTRHRPALISIDPNRPDQRSRRTRTTKPVSTSIVLMTTATQGVALMLAPGSGTCLIKAFDLDDLLACATRYVVPLSRLRPYQRSTYWTWPERSKLENTHQ